MTSQSVEDVPVVTKHSYCKVCMSHCGLLVDVVNDERIIKVRGDKEHLTGGYTCPKGRATGELHHQANPITRPLMLKDGQLVEVGWDDALDDIAAELRTVIDTYGPDAVAINFGSGLGLDSSGYAMEEAFYNVLRTLPGSNGAPPKFSPMTIDSAYPGALMHSGVRLGGGKTDYDNVNLVIYVGINPMVSHGDNNGMWDPATWLRSITKRGGEVWTIDPVRTATANLSTGHIQPYPGKDYAVLAWVVRELIDNGPCTPRFAVEGLEELRAVLEGYDRAKAAEIAGVPEQDLEDLLAAIRRKGRVAIETGTGIGMSTGANLTAWMCGVIVTLTGSDNQTGGTKNHRGFFYPMEKIEEMRAKKGEGTAAPRMARGFLSGSKVRPDVKAVLGPGGGPDWPCAVLPLEIEAGNIRAFFNFGGSLLRSFPDTNRLKAALPKLDLYVDTAIHHSERVPLCTHVLPTKDTVERPEITRWDTLRWNLSMEYSGPLVKPMGERRSAWWVISQIMKRAGLPVPEHVPDDDRLEGADDFMLSTLFTPMARCTFEELKENRYLEFPQVHPDPLYDKRLERAGGYKLVGDELLEQWSRHRAADEATLGKPKPLVYSSRRQFKQMNDTMTLLSEPHNVILHPDTAAEHGIENGQKVRVYNKKGEIFLTAKVEPTMRKGVCSISHTHPAEGNVNFLTGTDDIDLLTGMAHYSGVPIEIEPS
jgi:anaerobic selenocysteine-containing dehydrogenase